MSVEYDKKNLIPGPTIQPDNKPFWEGIERQELIFQKCGDCGALRHPPQPVCSKCRSLNVAWEPSSGKGKIHSMVTYHESPHPGLKAPYSVVLIEMEDGVNMVSNMVDIQPKDIKIGMQVEVVFDNITDDLSLPKFRKVN